MYVPNNISDDSCDRLVELMFCTMPGVEPDELALLLGAVLQIMSIEVRRATQAAHERMMTPSEN